MADLVALKFLIQRGEDRSQTMIYPTSFNEHLRGHSMFEARDQTAGLDHGDRTEECVVVVHRNKADLALADQPNKYEELTELELDDWFQTKGEAGRTYDVDDSVVAAINTRILLHGADNITQQEKDAMDPDNPERGFRTRKKVSERITADARIVKTGSATGGPIS